MRYARFAAFAVPASPSVVTGRQYSTGLTDSDFGGYNSQNFNHLGPATMGDHARLANLSGRPAGARARVRHLSGSQRATRPRPPLRPRRARERPAQDLEHPPQGTMLPDRHRKA